MGDDEETETFESADAGSSHTYPMEGGVVRKWEEMERIWDFVFRSQLRVNPDAQPLLLSQVPIAHTPLLCLPRLLPSRSLAPSLRRGRRRRRKT